jgi:4-hydroxy-4-methyl-2-oxoglutarate aldolase
MLKTFVDLSTPLVADACVRSDVPLRAAPPGIGAVIPRRRIAGRALPARHYGSVDVSWTYSWRRSARPNRVTCW